MKKPFLIGISGKAYSGKDFTADAIKQLFPDFKIYKIAYADAVRNMLKSIVDVDAIYKLNKKEEPIEGLGVSLRELMQSLGTDWGRHILGDNFWVNILNKRINDNSFLTEADVIVISDCRFQNEIEYIINRAGIVLNVITDSQEYKKSKFYEHESEMISIVGDIDPRIEIFNDFTSNYISSLKEILIPYMEQLR